MKQLKNQQGFTLIELVLVIVILGILAVAALPTFTDMSTQAATASMNGVVGAVRSGIGIYYSNELAQGRNGTYPAALGGTGQCTAAAPCFGAVITNGVTDDRWSANGTTFTYTGPGVTESFDYDPAAGTFIQQ